MKRASVVYMVGRLCTTHTLPYSRRANLEFGVAAAQPRHAAPCSTTVAVARIADSTLLHAAVLVELDEAGRRWRKWGTFMRMSALGNREWRRHVMVGCESLEHGDSEAA